MTSGDLNSSFDEFKSFFLNKKEGFLSNKNYVLMKKSLQK